MRKEFIQGVFHIAIAKYSGIVISLIISSILARIISPEEFGIVAIATVIITFFSIFSDLGIAPAIIQNKELTNSDLNNIFSFTIWLGIGISIIFFLSSWPISWVYKSSSLLKICQILAINLLFTSFNITPNALLLKNKSFKFIAYQSLAIQLIGGIAGIYSAIQGIGVYALTINPVFSSILLFITSLKKRPLLLKKTTGIKSMRKIFRFSFYQFLFNFINYFSRNLDKLLIGRFITMSDLGYYEKSYRLMMLPIQNITNVISPVMHPIFSDLQYNTQKLSISYEKIIRYLAFIGFPLSVLLWFCAKEIILIIFGVQWQASVPVFQTLSLTVGFQIILSTSGAIFQATNKTKSLFICGSISTMLNIFSLCFGVFLFKSLIAISWCICVSFTCNFMICYIWIYKFTLQRSIKHFFKLFLSPFILVFILILVLSPIHYLTNNFSIFTSVIIKLTLFILTYGVYIQKSNTYDIINAIKIKNQ